ncbi:mltA-interacting domain protein, partial [Yersinia pestis PY-36]
MKKDRKEMNQIKTLA